MLTWLVPLALKGAELFLGFAQKRQDNALERFRIETGLDIEEVKAGTEQARIAAGVVTSGMAHKAFWIPWLIATVPLSAWFCWGVLDSMLWNGTVLPDTATLTPQLKEYADVAWANLFYSGAAVGGVQGTAQIIARAVAARKRSK